MTNNLSSHKLVNWTIYQKLTHESIVRDKYIGKRCYCSELFFFCLPDLLCQNVILHTWRIGTQLNNNLILEQLKFENFAVFVCFTSLFFGFNV